MTIERGFYFSQVSGCCGNPLVSPNGGFNVCLNCGEVYSKVFNNTPRRAYTPEEVLKRTNNEVVYSEIGPRTYWSRSNRDAQGQLLDPKVKALFFKLLKIQNSINDSYERNLIIALPQFNKLKKELNLPSAVVEDGRRIYKEAIRMKISRGRCNNIETLAAACLYAAIRVHKIPRSVQEVLNVSQLWQKSFSKNLRKLIDYVLPKLKLIARPLTVEDWLDTLTESLRLPMDCRHFADKLLKIVRSEGVCISGKDPKGCVAGALYIAAKILGENRSQKEVAAAAKISGVTLRKRWKEYLPHVDLVPQPQML